MEAIAVSGPAMVFLIHMTGFAGVVDLLACLFAGLPARYTCGANKFSADCGAAFAAARFLKNGALALKGGTKVIRPMMLVVLVLLTTEVL